VLAAAEIVAAAVATKAAAEIVAVAVEIAAAVVVEDTNETQVLGT
jgi:hypothetical protein